MEPLGGTTGAAAACKDNLSAEKLAKHVESSRVVCVLIHAHITHAIRSSVLLQIQPPPVGPYFAWRVLLSSGLAHLFMRHMRCNDSTHDTSKIL